MASFSAFQPTVRRTVKMDSENHENNPRKRQSKHPGVLSRTNQVTSRSYPRPSTFCFGFQADKKQQIDF
jgi:hypothetical protein